MVEISKQKLNDITIIRAIAVIIVVAFHCYGMMYAGHFPNSVEAYKKLYYIPNQCILINIAMPMFVFVSGYLFQFLLGKGKYSTWSNLIKKKAQRILLSYFVFGLVFMSTTGNFHPLELFKGDYWHLWFLPMLFWRFFVGYALHRYNNTKYSKLAEILVLLLCYVGSWMPKFIPEVMGLQYLSLWFLWFYLGQMILKYKEVVYAICGKYYIWVLLLFVYIVINCIHMIPYGERSSSSSSVSQICILISLSYLANRIDWMSLRITKPLFILSGYSFGIYIFHNWIAMNLISNTMKRIFSLDNLVMSHTILFPLTLFIVTMTISWMLTWSICKTKVGRYLIG